LLIKIIRLLANLSISPEIGPKLSGLDGVSVLIPLLEMVSQQQRHEELLLNAVSAVTNLTFYFQPGDAAQQNVLLGDYSKMCAHLMEVLLHENSEVVTEAARAFGNLSRDAEVITMMSYILESFFCLCLCQVEAPPPPPPLHRCDGVCLSAALVMHWSYCLIIRQETLCTQHAVLWST
jgi:hypothetical protein